MADIFVAEHPGPAGSPRVVFVHGSLDRSTAFLRTIRLLDDVTTVRYDRRGYGKSVEAGVCATFAEQVDDLAGIVRDEPSVLFGHSLGGVVALAFAARHPELAPAVVAYESPMAWLPWWSERQRRRGRADVAGRGRGRGRAVHATDGRRRAVGGAPSAHP